MYEIQQHTGYQWEPVAEGEFTTEAEAIAGMKDLETNLGWRDLRAVKQVIDAETGWIFDRETILVGQESDEDEDE